MKKKNVVKENRDFAKIINNGQNYWNECFSLYIYNNECNNYRFGISVSKKIGNAVTRNKIKRQVRNIIDKYKNIYQNDKDYIIIIRKKYINFNFQEICNKYIDLINRTNDIKEKDNEEKN